MRPLRDARRERERLATTDRSESLKPAAAQRHAPCERRSYCERAAGSDSVVYAALIFRNRSVASGWRGRACVSGSLMRWSSAGAKGTRRFVDVRVELERQLAVRGLQRLGCMDDDAQCMSKARQMSASCAWLRTPTRAQRDACRAPSAFLSTPSTA